MPQANDVNSKSASSGSKYSRGSDCDVNDAQPDLENRQGRQDKIRNGALPWFTGAKDFTITGRPVFTHIDGDYHVSHEVRRESRPYSHVYHPVPEDKMHAQSNYYTNLETPFGNHLASGSSNIPDPAKDHFNGADGTFIVVRGPISESPLPSDQQSQENGRCTGSQAPSWPGNSSNNASICLITKMPDGSVTLLCPSKEADHAQYTFQIPPIVSPVQPRTQGEIRVRAEPSASTFQASPTVFPISQHSQENIEGTVTSSKMRNLLCFLSRKKRSPDTSK